MAVAKLGDAERAAALASLPAWSHDQARDALTRRFTFPDFATAFGFMTRVAGAAERLDHHPEWSNSWNRVDVLLTTHECGGLSGRDLALAREIDGLVG